LIEEAALDKGVVFAWHMFFAFDFVLAERCDFFGVHG
jgi:hypothetical protein